MMTTPTKLTAFALACLLIGAPARAEFAASSASSGSSASVASLSDSVSDSSERSSAGRKVAQGEYRVVQVAELRLGVVRLTLQAMAPRAGDADLYVDLPPKALAARALAVEDIVRISHRPYGLEFAFADTRQAFFLALTDDWLNELEPRAVTL